jgi:hypothetical protein
MIRPRRKPLSYHHENVESRRKLQTLVQRPKTEYFFSRHQAVCTPRSTKFLRRLVKIKVGGGASFSWFPGGHARLKEAARQAKVPDGV